MRWPAAMFVPALALWGDVSNERRSPGRVIFTTGNKVYRAKPGGQQQGVFEFELEDRSWPRIAPDGRRFAVRSGRKLNVVEIEREQACVVAMDPEDWFGWSWDGWRLAYFAGGKLMTVAADGTDAREVCAVTRGGAVAWGRKGIAYSDGAGVWVVQPDGSDRTQLHAREGDWFSFDRSGRQLVFESDSEIFAADVVTKEVRQLTKNAVEDHAPEISPDGRRIAFYSYRDGNCEVYCMDADGANLVRLTNEPKFDEQPRWSPDGRWIVFASNRNGDYDLYVVRPDGDDLKRLTDNPGDDYRYDW